MGTRRIPYFRFFPGEFLAETALLSPLAVAAHISLIAHIWLAGPVADDDEILARAARLTPAKWRKIRSELATLWTIENGLWYLESLEETRKFSEKAFAAWRANSAGGGAKTRTKFREKSNGSDGQLAGQEASQTDGQAAGHTATEQDNKRKNNTPGPRRLGDVVAADASRPNDWRATDGEINAAVARGVIRREAELIAAKAATAAEFVARVDAAVIEFQSRRAAAE